jgi:hypothetical protein
MGMRTLMSIGMMLLVDVCAGVCVNGYRVGLTLRLGRIRDECRDALVSEEGVVWASMIPCAKLLLKPVLVSYSPRTSSPRHPDLCPSSISSSPESKSAAVSFSRTVVEVCACLRARFIGGGLDARHGCLVQGL